MKDVSESDLIKNVRYISSIISNDILIPFEF